MSTNIISGVALSDERLFMKVKAGMLLFANRLCLFRSVYLSNV